MNKSEREKFVIDIAKAMEDLSTEERMELSDIFLSWVYASFFLFEPMKGVSLDLGVFLDSVLSTQLELQETIPEHTIFNISSLFSTSALWEDFQIWNVYLFPFIQIPYVRYKQKSNNVHVQDVLSKFESVFHRHLCVMEIAWKIVVFTDIAEDFFDIFSIEDLSKKWYRKVELHNIIPKIISSLSDDFDTWEAEIGQLWISFPLSMLGPHASIVDKVKNRANVSADENFKRVIRYGLLDSVQINAKFKISFNSENEKDKYKLPWYLYSGGTANIALLRNLKAFLEEVSASNWDNDTNNNFAWLPIYVIAGKRNYRVETDYPRFRYLGSGENFVLYLDFDTNTSTYDGDSTIKGDFQITWIYPQYLKVWDNPNTKSEVYCHLHELRNSQDWSLTEESIKKIFPLWGLIPCGIFLNEIRDCMSKKYRYISEELWDIEEEEKVEEVEEKVEKEKVRRHGHPNLMASDFFMTARLESNPSADYLINITNPKTANRKNTQEKLGRKISVELYRLACFDFWIKKIKESVNIYKFSDKRVPIGSMEIMKYTPKDWSRRILLNWNFFTNLTTPCTPAIATRTNSGWKSIRGKYSKPVQYNSFAYIDDCLPEEDVISLSFIELLNQKKYYDWVFFGWKKSGAKARELADIITIKKFPKTSTNGEWIEIGLMHIKSDPFLQRWTSSIDSSFALYTTVVGQILEKMKPFLEVSRKEDLLTELEVYFQSGDTGNYEIFRRIKEIIMSATTNDIVIRVYFPVREKDYFEVGNADENKLKALSLETNWKRLKIVSDVFSANTSNTNPNLHIRPSLWLIVCQDWKEPMVWLKDDTKVNIQLFRDVRVLLK